MPSIDVSGPDGSVFSFPAGTPGDTIKSALAKHYGAPQAPAAPAAAPRFPYDKPGTTYGSVLPFAKDDKTGAVSLAVPEMIRAPLRGIISGGEKARGMHPESIYRALSPDEQAAVLTMVPELGGPKTAAKTVQATAAAAKDAAAEIAPRMGGAAADVIGGVGTHTGGESIRQAYRAGRAGGEQSKLFLDAIRNNAPQEQVVSMAREALAKMREDRSKAYVSGMVDMKKDPAHLSFDGVKAALNDIRGAAEYEGKVVNPEAAAKLREVSDAVADWEAGDPGKFHTVQGLDALKQRIGAVLEQTQPHTRASAAVGRAYDAVRDEISRQAPEYGKVMKDYEEASTALRELESAMSIKDKGAQKNITEPALRKLQSVMRNNAHTNYGSRLEKARTLDEISGGKIMPQLAGQALQSTTPRGLGSLGAAGTIYEATVGGHPWSLAALPFQSPRLVGEAAHGLGVAARGIKSVVRRGKPDPNAVLDSLEGRQ